MDTDASSSRKKIFLYLGIVLSLAFAILLFVGGMLLLMPVFDNYFHETKEISNLYDFYDLKVGENSTSVYITGASSIGDAVYPADIKHILTERGYGNISVYNLYVSGEGPLDKVIQVQKIIDSHPSLVILGLSNALMTSDSIIEDNVLIVQDRLNVRNDSLFLYSEKDKNLLKNGVNLWEMKRFIRGALTAFFTEGVRTYVQTYDYATDPIGDAATRIAKTEFRKTEVDPASLNVTDEIRYSVSNRSVEALKYFQDTLRKAGIDVVVVNVPLNPFYTQRVTNESKREYTSVLDAVSRGWYDLESSLDAKYFVDNTHTTFDGALELSPVWADIIIKEFEENHAVYHA